MVAVVVFGLAVWWSLVRWSGGQVDPPCVIASCSMVLPRHSLRAETPSVIARRRFPAELGSGNGAIPNSRGGDCFGKEMPHNDTATLLLGSGATKRSSPHLPKGDERGAVFAQTLLLLPILALVVFGGYNVWRVASVKHSLHSGTYQATRYLCLNPVDPPVPVIWEEVVREFVTREMDNNGLARGVSRPQAVVTFQGNQLRCGLEFTVDTWLSLRIDIPYLSMPLTLRDRHDGWVECGG